MLIYIRGVWQCMVWYGLVWYGMVWYGTVWSVKVREHRSPGLTAGPGFVCWLVGSCTVLRPRGCNFVGPCAQPFPNRLSIL